VKINVDEPKRNSSKILLARLLPHHQILGKTKEFHLLARRE
jgi:hypothetical protein